MEKLARVVQAGRIAGWCAAAAIAMAAGAWISTALHQLHG